jgi:uncharacterized membrane protein
MPALLDSLLQFLAVFAVSLLPVVELRGAVVLGYTLDLPPLVTYAISVVGNILPIPFVLMFVRRLFEWLQTKDNLIARLIRRRIEISVDKSRRLKGSVLVALAIFVAIPLPGTGAWTGAIIAAFLELRVRHAVPAIFIGVLIAGAIMISLSYGLLDGIKFALFAS